MKVFEHVSINPVAKLTVGVFFVPSEMHLNQAYETVTRMGHATNRTINFVDSPE